jgi:DNA-binding NarL/FixJ family response regulator
VLRRALAGQTDVEIASALIASHSTIKKRWLAIYDRVVAVDTQLLPASPAGHPDEHHRGAEKRRHLINYLHDHPEELLPIHAGRNSAQCRASGNSEDLE